MLQSVIENYPQVAEFVVGSTILTVVDESGVPTQPANERNWIGAAKQGALIGLVIGLVLALVVPDATWISMLGTLFVGALKAIAPILVFVLVASSLAQSRTRLGSQFTTIVVLYLLSTFLAAVVAVLASTFFPVTLDQLGKCCSESCTRTRKRQLSWYSLLGCHSGCRSAQCSGDYEDRPYQCF